MMRIFIVLIIAILMTSCFSSSNNKKKKERVNYTTSETLFDLSAQTRIFLDDLKKEQAAFGEDSFVPSARFIEKYSIQKIQDNYAVAGFIKINSEFDIELLYENSIHVGSKTNQIISIIVPLNHIAEFLEIKGISYFEINKKAEIKSKQK